MNAGENQMGDDNKAKRVIENIIENYEQLEKSIVNQLKMCNKLHAPTTGSAREDVWLQLFELMVPKKFVIEHSIFIIDSFYNISREVDLAIIDNSYTPYIFQYGRIKYVPIEAVAAVIECKSTRVFSRETDDDKYKEEGLAVWCSSIRILRTSRESIARMATGTVIKGKADRGGEPFLTSTQTSTRPIRIFCGYKTKMSPRVKETIEDFFDFILAATDEGGESHIEVRVKERDNLAVWYKELDHYEYENESKNIAWGESKPIEAIENERLKAFQLKQYEVSQGGKKISMLTFNFQLNQLLMLINNPILFPHLAYVKMFNGEQREKDC